MVSGRKPRNTGRVPPSSNCSVCGDDRVAQINTALAGSTPIRAIARAFSLSRGKVERHAHLHVKSTETRLRRIRARTGLGIGVTAESRVTPAAPALLPLVTPEDVVGELERLRGEANELFVGAKDRSDWKQAQMLFGALLNLVDRFGELHRLFGSKSSTTVVNVDQRTMKIEAFMDRLPIPVLVKLQSGEITIESLLGHSLDAEVGV
jgi:hypothetical protein